MGLGFYRGTTGILPRECKLEIFIILVFFASNCGKFKHLVIL